MDLRLLPAKPFILKLPKDYVQVGGHCGMSDNEKPMACFVLNLDYVYSINVHC